MPDIDRRLVIMRHGTAESHAARDRERELTAAGRREAAAVGTWLTEVGIRPDHAIVSAAHRTRGTWAAVADAAGWRLDPAYDDALYEAGTDSALEIVHTAPEEARTLLLIGHNPTVALLAQLLQDGIGDPDAGTEMARGFPPASVAVLRYAGEWQALGYGTAQLERFRRGR